MDSKRANQAFLLSPQRPVQSDEAAFSSKIGLFFLNEISDAGLWAGVFIGARRIGGAIST
ncbi:MAG: hypothetical protein ACRYGK_17455 [Janthinobacterium lividum]